MRRYYGTLVLAGALLLGAASCGSEQDPVNQVGVNVVDKSIFTGSWYVSRTVIDVDYEAAGIGTYPGDSASDFAGTGFSSIPRIRWVIDEEHIFAYRDYQRVNGVDGEIVEPGDALTAPVAAFAIESHFDIKRRYSSTTGEELNILYEDTADRRWYERQYMRVDWSKNLLPGYYGQIHHLYEVLGLFIREPADLYVQSASEFPESWKPQFHYMGCSSTDDTSADCTDHDRDWAGDFAPGDLYHMSFVNQEMLSPGIVPDPFTGRPVDWCQSIYSDAPTCTTTAVNVRTSFLRVPDKDCSDGYCREYEAVNWTDSRFDRAGYFRLEQDTWDRSTAADDPAYFATDFRNYNINRHNIWRRWFDAEGAPLPYSEREVRPIIWYSTPELPAHLVKPSMGLVGEWNRVLMSTVRNLQNRPDAEYPRVDCQTADPDAYCYCTTDGGGEVLNPSCPGKYDPFLTPEQAVAAGAVEPYDCYVTVPDGAEPDMNNPALSDSDFYGWYGAEMVGTECVNVLRMNTCHRGAVAENGGTMEGLVCEERGDMRFKFLSYVDQPGTAFLGIATLRGDPVSGEIIVGDANIGGPALDGYRTFALQQYDLVNGDITEEELLTGEDVRSYLENLNNVALPAPPRVDFSVANLGGLAARDDLRSLDHRMQNILPRLEALSGEEGRAQIYSDRLKALAGSDIEKRLFSNMESFLMAGMGNLPAGTNGSDVTEHILDQVSPFRRSAHDMLHQHDQMEQRISGANVMMPNAFIDDSIMNYVNQHRDWPRARLEFEMNRSLYYETQLHEMGHCFGLRHSFAASADYNNYFDDYYYIDERYPLADPAAFDTDGTPGLSSDEQIAYEDAYNESRSQRELAGIDKWMNTSIMEYTANWYERTVTSAGRYDVHAMASGYGDLVEVYDNSAGLTPAEITPVNTTREFFTYYHGGETCSADADCPFSTDGLRSPVLSDNNKAAGLTQTCTAHPRNPDLGGVCSNFDTDIRTMAAASATPRWAPVDYMYCTDERATGGSTATATIGVCNRFDEGNSYREIVRNIAESYERMYLWENFRRYRSGFDIGNYLGNRLIGRRLIILQSIYQNLVYKYLTDPGFRTQEGPFGFYDQFLATADVMNFYGRIMAQPDVGTYRWNPQWERYERAGVDPDAPGAQLAVPLGLGRYFSSIYQSGLSGITRVERIGTFYDKLYVLQMMTDRNWGGFYPGRDLQVASNFYDLFPLETQQLFGGLIRDDPNTYSPRLQCASGSFPNCTDPRLVYMDFYRGDCTEGSEDCRPDPVTSTYRDMAPINGGGSFLLQFLATSQGLAQFPVFFDTTFQNQLFVCIEGQGDCHRPNEGAAEGVDYVRHTSERYGKSFLAYQVEPTSTVANQRSIGFEMVGEAHDSAFLIRMLQKYRGDFGGTPYDAGNLTGAERTRLDTIGYELPGSDTTTSEINRLDGRLSDLESFFNQLIQLEREYGVASYF